MTLISETQEGNVGDTWKYDLEAKVFSQGLKGEATVSVPKHQLSSGEVRSPHTEPDPVVLFEGVCEDELLLRLKLRVTEIDLLINDVGEASKDIRLEKPCHGKTEFCHDFDIAAGVRESPGILNKNAVFTLRLRILVENCP
jgi:hypothetical protein